MANYRPKSLDELNSFYDKKLSSQNVIEDTASSISTEAFTEEPAFSSQAIDDFFAEQTPLTTGHYGDLTEDINRFIANFGKPATKEDEYEIRHRPVPIKLRQTPTQPKPVRFTPDAVRAPSQQTETAVRTETRDEAEPKPVQQEAPAPAEAKPEKTELIITAEKNELFEEYMRIMSDEDDDAEYSRSRSSRKRKKNKKSAESAVHTKPTEEAPAEEAPEAVVLPLPETEEEAESFVSFALAEEKEPVKEEKTESVPSATLSFPENEEEYDEDNGEDEKEKQPRKKSFTQLLLFLLLFVTLITALAVTALQTVVKVNSGELFADKYYAYTADYTDKVADINEGELIIIENVAAQNGQVFAYTTPDGIGYAVQTFSGEPERTSGKNAISDSVVVLNTSIKGTVVRCFASMGKTASLISENFMTVIVSLLVLAIFIILLIIFSFRKGTDKGKASSKDNFSFDDEEDFFEASDDGFSLE